MVPTLEAWTEPSVGGWYDRRANAGGSREGAAGLNILSIQSSVAYGHVGNSAAVFPLQRMGFEVWPVNAVHFSNHTGYGDWRGSVLAAEDVAGVVRGIENRGALAGCDAVLSGYMGDASLGEVIVGAVGGVKVHNPKAVYRRDPVMGDADGGFFVRPAIPEFVREVAVPVADVITPNQFELEFLTGVKVRGLDDALGAADEARRLGPETVLTTSLRRMDAASDVIEMLAVSEEGWSLLDAFYFSSITLATVGYGDRAPVTPAGKIFTVFYLFTGIGLIVAFLNAVARAAVEQREEGRKRPPEDGRRPK